jgi:hypothetical protein
MKRVRIEPSITSTSVDRRPTPVEALTSLRLAPSAAPLVHVSAASGIIALGNGGALVIMDDVEHAARFGSLRTPGELTPALSKRRRKSDLESIIALPRALGGPIGASGGYVLAMGSGSTLDERRAALWTRDASGNLSAPTRIDLSPLYEQLNQQLEGRLDIEGMALRDGANGAELLLFSRAQRRGDTGWIFVLDAAAALRELTTSGRLTPAALIRSVALDLGTHDGVPIGFSDARAMDDGSIAFVASAEGTGRGRDGDILGSWIGRLDASLAVKSLRPFTGPPRKAEGLERAQLIDPNAAADEFFVVTDPDDATKPSELLRVRLDA